MTRERTSRAVLNLRREEIEQLLHVLELDEQGGGYYGVRKHYMKRHHDIRCKLMFALDLIAAMESGKL